MWIHLKLLEAKILQRLGEAHILFSANGGLETMPGILSLSFPGKEGEALLHRLDLMGIYISTGSACDSQETEISHVLKSIQLGEQEAIGTIRISLGYENTEEDAEDLAKALIRICQ